MAPDPHGRLPVAVRRFDMESGMSHVMRAFWENGLSMDRACQWLKVQLTRPLRTVDARVLAWAVQAPTDWLSERLAIVSDTTSAWWLQFGGQEISAPLVLIGRAARICPLCLSELGFCEMTWSIRLAPVCQRHGCLLLGACGHCRRPIGWDRPNVDICNCGRYFRPAREVGQLPKAVFDWTRWVALRLAWPLGSVVEAGGQLSVPKMLNEMSLDGALRLVMAFGLLQRPDQQPRGAATAARSIEGAVGVIARGLERISLIEANLRRIRDISPQIHLDALERLRARAMCAADMNCASLLLRHVADRSDCDVDMRGRHVRGQMTLFD